MTTKTRLALLAGAAALLASAAPASAATRYCDGERATIAGTSDSVLPEGEAEAALRRLHSEIPDRPGIWNRDIEGSYAPLGDLRDNARVGEPWLFVDRGHREIVLDPHCNTPHTRWILRNHGISIDGPPPAEVVAEVEERTLRDEARKALPGTLDETRTWADRDHAWTQRYVVQTYCRVLYTALTGRVASKPDALRWAAETLDPGWRPLLAQVAADRLNPWKPVDPPRPGSMELAYAFAAYVEHRAAGR